MGASYDYVICGGGVGGLVLAARLSALAPTATVLVLEAGVDPSATECITSSLGSQLARTSEHAFQLAVAPNPHLGGRGAQVVVGKALGGSAAINGGLWTRGPAVDYDTWAEQVGDAAWSYEALLPFFRRVENVAVAEGGVRDEHHHGYDGYLNVVPLETNFPVRKYPLRETVKNAWAEAGVEYVGDGGNGSQNGLTELVEVWVKGLRQLPNKVLDLSRVEVREGASVARVLFEEKKGPEQAPKACGVELVGGETIAATKEVVLATGVYHTPKLLMLSGVGDPAELAKHGIQVVHANPQVGKNLRDHLAVGLTWKLKDPEQGLAVGSPLFTDPSYFAGWPMDFVQFGNLGDDASLGSLAANDDDRAFLLRPGASHIETVFLYTPMGERLSGVDAPMDGSHVTSISVCLATTSRGTVSLASSNLDDPPVIDTNFNATESDRFILRQALRKNASVWLETETGKSFISHEVVPAGYAEVKVGTSDEEINKRIQDFGYSLDHPLGSCSMGQVVDSHCRVIGVDGLRVVDGSVIPVPIACHIQAAVYVLAERVAEWLANGD